MTTKLLQLLGHLRDLLLVELGRDEHCIYFYDVNLGPRKLCLVCGHTRESWDSTSERHSEWCSYANSLRAIESASKELEYHNTKLAWFWCPECHTESVVVYGDKPACINPACPDPWSDTD